MASFMAAITIISKVLGLLREIFLASIYGASFELTAFLAASKIPLTLFDITLGSVVSAAFIPIYTQITATTGAAEANDFATDYTNLVLMITATVTVAGMIFAAPIISFTLSGAEEATLDLATRLLQIMFPMIIFTGVAYTLVGILNCNQEFYITAILSLISNAAVIAYLCFNRNIYGLAVMMLVSWALQVAVQIPAAYKFGFRYKIRFAVASTNICAAVKLALPILVSSWAYPVSSLINMKMASYIDGGNAVSYMELANRLYVVISGIFAYVISNLSYPYLARAATDEFVSLVRIILKSITFIIVPIMIGLIVLGVPIVSFAYERGNFTSADSLQTGRALTSIGFAMLAFSYNEALNKIFYAKNRARVAMLAGITGAVFTIALCFILPKYFGIMGLGFSIAAGAIATFVINFYHLNQLFAKVITAADYLEFAKIATAGLIMGITVYYVERSLTGSAAKVFVPTILGALEYFALALIFRVKILTELMKGVSNGQ
ncbi:murein biosynthesis integral membrane protein MurJ [Candidatus Epulonipiscium viviparus]|uniref:murein biosynthesis integral membrane protein MurJ n=1 Tax=Candidatus Epulonipiscium viviparus TaxID=420336 RepID=UPI00273807F0|nr:murein biosynthesis integral membrane protein MurJ [Candidatus Epulopiscium viviparus]